MFYFAERPRLKQVRSPRTGTPIKTSHAFRLAEVGKRTFFILPTIAIGAFQEDSSDYSNRPHPVAGSQSKERIDAQNGRSK